jgi:hypothetical protein
MSVVGPSRLITAPLPLLIVMPISLTEIIAPPVVWIRMPPVGPGVSLMTMPFVNVVCSVMPAMPGGTAFARAGVSAALPQ